MSSRAEFTVAHEPLGRIQLHGVDLTSIGPVGTAPQVAGEAASVAVPVAMGEQFTATGSPGWAIAYRKRAVLTDALTALCVAIVATRIAGITPEWNRPVALFYLGTTITAPLLWPVMIALGRGYDRKHLATGTGEFRAIVSAAVRLLAITGLLSYATYSGRPLLSRYAVLFFFTVLPTVSLLLRHEQRRRIYRRRADGHASSRTLVVGHDDAVNHLLAELERDPGHGLAASASCRLPRHLLSDPVEHVMEQITLTRPDVVILTSPSGLAPSAVRRLSWLLEDEDVDLMVSPGLLDVVGPRLSIRPAAGLPCSKWKDPESTAFARSTSRSSTGSGPRFS
ncbi:nucleoside-diphosphate sugar epimerase/dehydratase [Flexivirga alba]|uniref:Nucleoside-diphosphate sugar epimerase/dehydratase n=1 Tax=Flexivirga alba TaxID=702742 RepID=A0ABW2AFZ4_9MICO